MNHTRVRVRPPPGDANHDLSWRAERRKEGIKTIQGRKNTRKNVSKGRIRGKGIKKTQLRKGREG